MDTNSLAKSKIHIRYCSASNSCLHLLNPVDAYVHWRNMHIGELTIVYFYHDYKEPVKTVDFKSEMRALVIHSVYWRKWMEIEI